MTVSRPSLRIRRGRWRTRALAASPTAAERTARCSTGVRRAPKNSSAMARSCSSHCSTSSADLGAGARASNSSARRRAVRRWTGMLRRSISRLGVSMVLSISTHHHGQSEPYCPVTPSPSVRRPAQPRPASQSIFAYTLLREIGNAPDVAVAPDPPEVRFRIHQRARHPAWNHLTATPPLDVACVVLNAAVEVLDDVRRAQRTLQRPRQGRGAARSVSPRVPPGWTLRRRDGRVPETRPATPAPAPRGPRIEIPRIPQRLHSGKPGGTNRINRWSSCAWRPQALNPFPASHAPTRPAGKGPSSQQRTRPQVVSRTSWPRARIRPADG